MKENIHPKFYQDCKVHCTCGETFTTGSTMPEIRVEVCSKCHPFYTGKSRTVNAGGPIDRFKARYGMK